MLVQCHGILSHHIWSSIHGQMLRVVVQVLKETLVNKALDWRVIKLLL